MAAPMMSMVGFKDVIVFVRGFIGNAAVIAATQSSKKLLASQLAHEFAADGVNGFSQLVDLQQAAGAIERRTCDGDGKDNAAKLEYQALNGQCAGVFIDDPCDDGESGRG